MKRTKKLLCAALALLMLFATFPVVSTNAGEPQHDNIEPFGWVGSCWICYNPPLDRSGFGNYVVENASWYWKAPRTEPHHVFDHVVWFCQMANQTFHFRWETNGTRYISYHYNPESHRFNRRVNYSYTRSVHGPLGPERR